MGLAPDLDDAARQALHHIMLAGGNKGIHAMVERGLVH
jgi:hypothetical protein